MVQLREGLILVMGNPLLDISVTVDDALLEKYGLKANDSILAEEKHTPLYEEIVMNDNVEYIVGGSAQNTARIIQVLLKKPNVVTYMGSVGKDKYSEIMKEKAKEAGVNVNYQYNEKEQTGTCAVLLTNSGKNRSLCAYLGAANYFTVDHVKNKENESLIGNASFYYIGGFFLTVSPESILHVAKIALKNNGVFMINLSAPFISAIYGDRLSQVLPYVDILFGNDTEALAFAEKWSIGTTNVKDIALKIANLEKYNENRKRVVVITQGAENVILVEGENVQEFTVDPIPPEKMVDTNGAGDAFVGGFIAKYVQGEPYEVCVKSGNWAASKVIQSSGCILNA